MGRYLGTALQNDVKDLIEESPLDLVEYQANAVLPEKTVTEKSGEIPVLSTSAGMKQLDLKRAPRSTFQRAEWVWGSANFVTYEYGYEEPIDNVEKLENSDIFNEEVVVANIARSQLMLAREKRVADAVFNATTFTGATKTKAITTEWSNIACTPYLNTTEVHDIMFAKNGIPRARCELLMNEIVFRNVMKSTEIQANLKYTMPIDKMSEPEKRNLLAQYLGIKQVNIATSFADSTAIGIENAEFSRLWSNEYAMFYFPCPNVDSWRVKGLGRQPVYAKFSPSYIIEDYPEPQSDSLIVRAREYRGEFINTMYGVLLSNMTA